MAEFVDYLTCPRNIIEDLKILSNPHKSKGFASAKNSAKQRSASVNIFTVRNSVCVAGSHRDSVMSVKHQVFRLLADRCALESFHFQTDDDIKDGALFVPKIILVAVFQPGRKLIDDDGEEGQLDQVYDEIYQIGAELLVVYVDLPELIYPPVNTRDLFHPRMEQLVFPNQKVVKCLASHGLLLTVTENNMKLNPAQESRMLEWLLKPIDPDTHPIFRACALINSLRQQGNEDVCPLKVGREETVRTDAGDDRPTFDPRGNSPESSQGSGGKSWISKEALQMRLEPKSRLRSSSFTSSDEEGDQMQAELHGFMRSMESYPLLKRNSRGRKKKGLSSSWKRSGNSARKSESGRNENSFYHYGSVVTEDGLNFMKHKEIIRIAPM